MQAVHPKFHEEYTSTAA